jgi:hypothetical protein
MIFQNSICLGIMVFLSVWIENDHMFMLIFRSPEFKKLMIGDKKNKHLKNRFFWWDLKTLRQ